MLGQGRYVFKDGSQQVGEYVLEKVELNNNYERDDISEANGREKEYITKWRCKKRIFGSAQQVMVPEEV